MNNKNSLIIGGIDFDLLYEQREMLTEMMIYLCNSEIKEEAEKGKALRGVIDLIDDILDRAEAEGYFSSEKYCIMDTVREVLEGHSHKDGTLAVNIETALAAIKKAINEQK